MANLRTPKEIFREEEIKQIAQFTETLKIDYCELDILRNPEDGRKVEIVLLLLLLPPVENSGIRVNLFS